MGLARRIVAGARVEHAQQVGEGGDAADRRAGGRRSALLLQCHRRRSPAGRRRRHCSTRSSRSGSSGPLNASTGPSRSCRLDDRGRPGSASSPPSGSSLESRRSSAKPPARWHLAGRELDLAVAARRVPARVADAGSDAGGARRVRSSCICTPWLLRHRARLRLGYGGSTGALVLWGIGAVVGGPSSGSPAGPGGTRRMAAGGAIGLLAAVAIAEGDYLIGILPESAVGSASSSSGSSCRSSSGGRCRAAAGILAVVPAHSRSA